MEIAVCGWVYKAYASSTKVALTSMNFILADKEKVQPSDETQPNTETAEQMIATDSQNKKH